MNASIHDLGGIHPPSWFEETCPRHHIEEPCYFCAVEDEEAERWVEEQKTKGGNNANS